MSNQNNNVNGLNPELGDLVTFTSNTTSTTGRIIYRDDTLIRIRPFHKRTRAVEFELDPETHTFLEKYGVREIQIHEKRKDPHYSKQLGLSRGDLLEFYNADGVKTGESKPVFDIIANEEYDGIQFDDGTTLDFGFLGTPEGVIVILSVPVEPEDNSTYDTYNDAAIPDIPEADISELMRGTTLIREVPSEELVYDDSIQREDMFVSLLMDYDRAQQQNPRVMQKLYRETDLLLALKNSVREKVESGALPTVRSYMASTLLEAIEKQPNRAPLASVIPVANVKRVVYGDLADNSKASVEMRSEMHSLGASQVALERLNQSGGTDILLFADYVKQSLKSSEAYSAVINPSNEKILVDQEVIRSALPPAQVDGLPALGDVDSLNSDNITQLRPQLARLLAGNVVRDPKRDVQISIADADSGKTVGHMLASPALSLRRAPSRSSVLIWDVLASNVSRSRTRLYIDEFSTEVKEIDTGDEFTLAALLESRITQTLSLSDRNVLTVTDSLGLRDLEMTDELMKPLDDALLVGQQKWAADYKKLIATAANALRMERAPALASLGPIADITDEPVGSVLQAIKERERLLHTLDLAVMNELNKEAESTLLRIYYGMIAAVPEPVMTNLKSIYESENSRQQRNTATKYEKAQAFTAKPTIINCPHVHEYELLMKIKDDQKRMIVFETFFNTYQSGEKDDYYVCGTCDTNLVCKHEVMMLQEFLSGNQNTHKELLLKYAGPVFEGNYTCKNCGQKIKELEYDTSLEFDDEGRPLIGRSVLETDESDETESRMMNEKFKDKPYDEKDPAANKKDFYYQIARTIMEKMGYVATKEIYGRMIQACIEYTELKIPERFRQDEKYVNAFGIGCLGALALIEFQINTPDIPIAAHGCTFSRSGFPKDDGPNTGALDYVVCAITSIQINAKPWNNSTWTVFSDAKKRNEAIKQIMKSCVGGILGTIGGSLPTASIIYNDLLQAARTGQDAVQLRAKDKLPPSFRPLTDYEITGRTPVANPEIFMQQADGNLMRTLHDVYSNERQLVQEVIHDLHTLGKTYGVISSTSKRSESECCFGDLAEIHRSGFSVDIGKQNELNLYKKVSNYVRARDPSAVNAGTHIFVPWSAPMVSTELPQPEPASYYKLFLKHCFRGPRNGHVHEFDINNACRHCDFYISDELILSKDKPDIYNRLATELVTTQVQMNDEVFKELEQAVRATKTTYSPILPDAPLALNELKELPFFDSMKSTQTELVALLTELNAGVPDQQRKIEFSRFFGTALNAAETKFKSIIALSKESMNSDCWNFISAKNKERTMIHTTNVLNILKKLTAHRIYGPRNIVRNFVIVAEQLSRDYTDTTKISNSVMSRWFGKYNKDHRNLLEVAWQKHAMVIELMTGVQKDYDIDLKSDIKSVCQKFSEWMGPLTRTWTSTIFPSNELQEKELIAIYHWVATIGLTESMNSSGPLYVDIIKNDERRAAVKQFMKIFITLTLENAESTMFVYQKTNEQIREAINTRKTKERAKIVERIDKVDRSDREAELIKKRLGLGEWSNVYTKKLTSSTFDMQLRQMVEFGVIQYNPEVAQGRAPQENASEAYGLGRGRAEGADQVNLAEYD